MECPSCNGTRMAANGQDEWCRSCKGTGLYRPRRKAPRLSALVVIRKIKKED